MFCCYHDFSDCCQKLLRNNSGLHPKVTIVPTKSLVGNYIFNPIHHAQRNILKLLRLEYFNIFALFKHQKVDCDSMHFIPFSMEYYANFLAQLSEYQWEHLSRE